MAIRVLIADDQSLVRAGFRLVLEHHDDIEVVGEASNGHEAVHSTWRLEPDVVLMDIRMPELDGIAATAQITQRHPAARVLVLTTYDLDEYVYDALQAGASGFLLKDSPPEQLAGGMSNAEIADHFVLGETTVKTHVAHVLNKLGLRDRVQAVVLAYESGLVTPGRADAG